MGVAGLLACGGVVALVGCTATQASSASSASLVIAERQRAAVAALPLCTSDLMPVPDVVRTGSRTGLVGVRWVLQVDGAAERIEPLPGFPGPGAPLYDAVSSWLAGCRRAPPQLGRPEVVEQVVALKMPERGAGPTAAPRDGGALVAAGGKLPSAARCEPRFPPAARWDAWVTVGADGTTTAVEVDAPAEPPKPERAEQRQRDEKLLRAWLDACHFIPARDADGQNVAARVRVQDDGTGAPALISLASMDRGAVAPVPACGTKPAPTVEIAGRGLTGLVLVGYVVDEAGHVSAPVPFNNPHPLLYEAVRHWLEACQFRPARLPDGRAATARIVQPFKFREGR